mmetsp:Transcript_7385/g.27121  ORF Transcript_7385/g.27121 Transcript_7385/m.27121 type:complete len:597 (+) Transcript_7385:66-1856(+)
MSLQNPRPCVSRARVAGCTSQPTKTVRRLQTLSSISEYGEAAPTATSRSKYDQATLRQLKSSFSGPLPAGCKWEQLERESPLNLLPVEKVDFILPTFRGNYAATHSEIHSSNLEVVHGEIPADFPNGTYVRNGPNAYLPPIGEKLPFIGEARHHWFEGDGMLHATTIKDGQASFRNRFIRGEVVQQEMKLGFHIFRPVMDSDPLPMLLNAGLNMLLSGSVGKSSANTNVLQHADRVYALVESSKPTEIDPCSLDTKGTYDFEGDLDFNFTAHPKKDVESGELVFFGSELRQEAPFCYVGVVSPEGKLVHKAAVTGLASPSLMHDFSITSTRTLLLDVPLGIDFNDVQPGEKLLQYNPEKALRMGIMPRFGSGKDIKWVDIGKGGMVFHTVNAYDEGDYVVLQAMWAPDTTISPPCDSESAYLKWIREEFLTGHSNACVIKEWKVNCVTGELVSERILDTEQKLLEFPKINPSFCGKHHTVSYSNFVDAEATQAVGAPLYAGIQKIKETADGSLQSSLHEMEAGVFCGEVDFIARPNATAEDDGWLVCYTHNEITGDSELRIVDCQDFTGPAAAIVKLPQRVPYGLHGAFIPEQSAA